MSSARACVNRIPDRDGSTVAIRRPPTIEYRQGRDGVDREPGDHLRVFVSIDVLLLDDDIAHEGLEHQGRHAHVALQQFAKLSERGNDVLFLDALHVRPPAGSLELLQLLPLGRKLPTHLLRLGEHRIEVRVIELGKPVGEPLELPVLVGDFLLELLCRWNRLPGNSRQPIVYIGCQVGDEVVGEEGRHQSAEHRLVDDPGRLVAPVRAALDAVGRVEAEEALVFSV